MRKKPVILVKIGGSLITDKNKPFSLNREALNKIAEEIRKVKEKTDKLLVIGHGGGSFPHVPAKKYRTHLGIINQKSYRGIAEVQDVAANLNHIVVDALVKKGLNAVSISPSSCYLASRSEPKKAFLEPLKKLLEFEMLPVLYGDVVLDEKMGCCILSTEKVLGFAGLWLKKNDFRVEKIIHCGRTDGVYDENGKTIPEITRKNFERYKKSLGSSGGIDVTGGMIHKVEEALSLAQKGIPALIIDGIVNSTLSKAVLGKKVLGTRIEW